MPSPQGFARTRALEVINKALESGSITLGGPKSAADPATAGKEDAQYLKALFHDLTETFLPGSTAADE